MRSRFQEPGLNLRAAASARGTKQTFGESVAMSANDAVDGSTAGIAMCHGGCFVTAKRGAARDGR